jgi:putative aminopeptidase FrvX
VYTASGPISGIMAIQDTGQRDLRVYLGTDKKKDTEDLGIHVGGTITVPKRSALDDRSGCAAMLLALMRIDPAKVKKTVTFAWTVEEEVGLRGAQDLAEKSKADRLFVVDTFASATPSAKGVVILDVDTGLEPLSEMIRQLILEF